MKAYANVNYLKRSLHYLFFSMITLILLAGGAQAAIQCYECHGTKSPIDYRPTDASYRNMTTGGFQGNHRTHMDSTADPVTCMKCHDNTGYIPSHRDAVIQFSANINSSPATGQYNVSGSPVTFKNQTSIPVRGSCSSANCHFETLTPTWGDAALGAPDAITCATCHNALPITNAHTKHITKYGGDITACTQCHSNHAGEGKPFQHATSAGRNIVVNAGNYAGSNYNYLPSQVGIRTIGTCSNFYCHSDGTTASTPFNVNYNPSWADVSNITCKSCHGGPVLLGAPILATGTHSGHIALSGVTCNFCHNATAADNATISTPANHADSSITINFNASAATASGTYNGVIAGGATVYQKAIASPAGVCATSLCHGSNSPTWGVNTTNDTCTKCHGTGTVTVNTANRYVVAPPINISGLTGTATGIGQVSNDPKVGAHQTHLRFLNSFSNYSTVDFRCENCHGTLPVTGIHANGSSTPVFQAMANNRGAMTPAWTAASLTCSNVYCHNPAGTGGVLNSANAGSSSFVSWTAASYLGDTAKTQANCGKCHKSPGDAGFTSSVDHSSYSVAVTDCSSCHGHNGDTSGVVGQRHMDGTLYGGGDCNSCHDYDTIGAAYAANVWTGGSWGKNSKDGLSPNEGWGAHAKHINVIKTRTGIGSGGLTASGQTFGINEPANVCGTCHTNTGSNHSTGGSTVRTINFGDSTFKIGGVTGTSLLFGASDPLYNGTSGVSSATISKTCSNISCHYYTTPVWSTY